MFPEAIARRRAAFDEAKHLSDWQVHSAHIAAGAIGTVVSDFQSGPLYVPMPTGSGKTVGAIWGIIDQVREDPSLRVCFLTPYKEAVGKVHSTLTQYLGQDQVGYYHSDAFTDKYAELRKPVVVLTHQFIPHNPGRLDDRDLFVVDEAIYATGEASLNLTHFADARNWATSHNVFPKEFTALHNFAVDMDRELQSSDKKFLAAPNNQNYDWAAVISDTLKPEDHHQSISNLEPLLGVQRFCEALQQGMVFLSKGNRTKDRYVPTFSAAVFGIPRLDKTVILSATGGMVYDIAGPFTQDSGSRNDWSPPDYTNLNLVQLSAPEIKGHYNHWKSGKSKQQVVAYFDWLLGVIPEKSIYITMPKAVLVNCLSERLNLPKKDSIEYPIQINTEDGKEVFITNHARSVGSNDFMNCEAVVYLWDNHQPQSVAIQRFHILSDEAITQDALDDANRGVLVGDYQRIREANYIDNMMQQLGRGGIRKINEHGVAGPMTGYILTDQSARFVRLSVQYRNCSTLTLEYDGIKVTKPVGRVAKVLAYIKDNNHNQDIEAEEVERAVGFKLRQIKNGLQGNWDLRMLGYEYEPGGKGRGKKAQFKWLG